MKTPNLRNLQVTTSSGKPVSQTSMLKGEAKNSLRGSNSLKQYETTGSGISGPKGGLNSGS